MTPFEQLVVVYFVVVLAAAIGRAGRRAALYALGAIGLVIVARFVPGTVRVWMPHAYLVLGYWIPAALVGRPDPRFERWLAGADERLAIISASSPVPAALLEFAYLICYPLVPAGFAVVLGAGSPDDVSNFWLSTLGAGYACYISLPWAAARPPRLMSAALAGPRPRGLARLNAAVLGRLSHHYVSFPSGHVAVSLAVAFSVGRVWPAAGACFAAAAVLIAAAAVAGRYHYAVDVLLGLLVGALVSMLTAWPG